MATIDPPINKKELEAFVLDLNELMGSVSRGSTYRGLTMIAGGFAMLLETYAKPNAENPEGMCDDVPAFRRHFADVVARAGSPVPLSGSARGQLEVGTNGAGEVVINHPDLMPDDNGVGHIVFSVEQALNLALVLEAKAREAAKEIGAQIIGEVSRAPHAD
jgi:hypothetical protein